MPDPALPLDRPALLAALRARIARLERGGAAASEAGGGGGAAAVPLCAEIDAALPWGGLARAGLHEVLSADPGAAGGFCALLLARASGLTGGGPVLWIAPEPDAWPPGLARFGLSPADLVLVRAPRAVDGLWAMEEALRCPAVAATLLVAREGMDLTAARRLQLAAEAGGALGLLLRPPDGGAAGADAAEGGGPSSALTRWRVEALAGTGAVAHSLGDPRWHLTLLRCRGGRPAAWSVVWRPAAERLELDGAERPEAGEEEAATPATRRRGAARAAR